MVNWKPKSCPRCGGDMFIDSDMDVWYEQCLQCSHRFELRRLTELKVPVVAGKKRGRKRAVS